MTIQDAVAFCILRWWWSQQRWDARAQTDVNSAMIVMLLTSVIHGRAAEVGEPLHPGGRHQHGDRLSDHTSERVQRQNRSDGHLRGQRLYSQCGDRRVKAVGTVSAVNIGSMFGNGWDNNIKSADPIPVLENSSQARIRRTARSVNGPSRINRSIPKRTTGSNSGATGLPSAQSMGACGALKSASRILKLVRIERGPNPPQSSKAEVYVPPADKMPLPGSGSVAIDSNGVVWRNSRGAHQMMSFDRRKCKVLNGPEATGQHCPDGWTVYKGPDPRSRARPTI